MALPIFSFNFRLMRNCQTIRNEIPITMMTAINKLTNIFLSVVVSPIEDNQNKITTIAIIF